MKVVILGANGFIGQHLTRFLLKKDLELVLFSRKFDPDLLELEQNENVKIVKGSLSEVSKVTDVLKGADLVYHLIWTSVPATSWENPYEEIKQNVLPGIKMLEICVNQGVKKVVFVSSAGTVYGEYHGTAVEGSSLAPFSPYGISKATLEFYMQYFQRKSGLNFDVFRISNLYGVGLNKKGFGVINTWLRKIQREEPLMVLGDGSAKKDFVFIDDAIKVLANSIDYDLAKSRLYNVCSSESITLKELIDLLFKVCQTQSPVIFDKAKASDNKEVLLSNRLILEDKIIEKFTSLEKGVSMIWQEMNQNPE